MNGKEFVESAFFDPPDDVREISARIIDHVTEEAMLLAVDAHLKDAAIDIWPKFQHVFDTMFSELLKYLDRINPTGAAELRRGTVLLAKED